MAQRVDQPGQKSFAEWYEDVPWSDDAYGMPWWLEPTVQQRMEEFTRGLLADSLNTEDMPTLNLHHDQLVFVYGTLKKGFASHSLMGDSLLVGRGWTALRRFKMIQGEFPVALLDTDDKVAKSIQGEVYLVPNEDMKHLDSYEGNGHLYRRRRMAIILDTGKTKPCWMYLGVASAFTAMTKLSPVYTRKKTGMEYYSYTKKS